MIDVPCFLRGMHGYTKTSLVNTRPHFKVNAEWACTNWHCPIRGRRGVKEDVYEPMRVELEEINGLKGVGWCEGAGLLER